MSVYYKFKSAKDYDSISIDGHFISVFNLKERIFESKQLGRGNDFDLTLSNSQTNEEYVDEATLIPKNTSVLVRRVPGQPRMRIVTKQEEPKVHAIRAEDDRSATSSFPITDSSVKQSPEETEWDEFGSDLYAVPEVIPVQSSSVMPYAPDYNKADEDIKIRAFIDMPALNWQMQPQEGLGAGRGFGRGMCGRMAGGRGFGRGGFESKTPPHGYICRRCKVPGHFIQHCPTNGDPNYDIKRVRQPTGIPKSMLMATPDGSYTLPSGVVAVFKPNEDAFEKEVEGLCSTRSVNDLPPEFLCPLCKEVMKDAVLTSKCCFRSFCYKCIRDHIISKSLCICGATNTLADDLLPNKTLRDSIDRILESNNSTAENAGSSLHVQDRESARSQPKVPSPALSATSKSAQMPPTPEEDAPSLKEAANEGLSIPNTLHQPLEKGKNASSDISVVTSKFINVREPQGSAPQANLSTLETGKIKKKKKTPFPANASDLQWEASQHLGAENYMMPYMVPGPSVYDPYWGGMQLGMNGQMSTPYPSSMTYNGYAPGFFDVPHGNFFQQGPFGGQGYFSPVPPQSMGVHPASRVQSRQEFKIQKVDTMRKRENEQRDARHRSMDWERGREPSSNHDVSSAKGKSRFVCHSSQERRPSRERFVQSSDDHQNVVKLKGDVFSRISEYDHAMGTKKRNNDATHILNEGRKKLVIDQGSSGDEQHFKHKRPSR